MTDQTAPILFYGPGTCSFGCIVTAEWQNLPYYLCRVDKAMRHDEAYKQINPLGQVPALKTQDGFVTQNPAVLQHLAAADMKTGLLQRPQTAEFDHTNQCLAYISSAFHTAFKGYWHPAGLVDDAEMQKAVKEKAIENIKEQYKNMDIVLKDKKYLVADKKGIADAYFYGLARWGVKFLDIKKDYPNVAAFMARMEEDKAVKYALEIEEKGEAKTTGKCLGHVTLDEAKAVNAKAA